MNEEICSIDSVLQRMQCSLACRICLDLLNNPLTTKCGHTFCKDCLNRLHIRGKSSYPCPLCMAPITKRSVNQNAKISTLVSAVRNVISSIKQDCGVREKEKETSNSLNTMEITPEETPIRRRTRNTKPVVFAKETLLKKKDIKKTNDMKYINDNAEVIDISKRKTCDELNNSVANSLLLTLPNKPAVNKVEQWLSKNESVSCGNINSENLEDLQPTQVFKVNEEPSKSVLCVKDSYNTNDDMNMWTSQCSTVIFNREEFLTTVKNEPIKLNSSKKIEENLVKEETNSMVSEKENKIDNQAKQIEMRRVSKRILLEPNKMNNSKRSNVKKTNKTSKQLGQELEDENKTVVSVKSPPDFMKKSDVENKECMQVTEKFLKDDVNNDHSDANNLQNLTKQHPNRKGHNIRFASSLEPCSSVQVKLSKLSTRGKGRKSPGWSRVESARKDLRSKQMSLNITGGEQKLNSSDISKFDSSKVHYESSQESVVIIEDQTQTEKKIIKEPPKLPKPYSDIVLRNKNILSISSNKANLFSVEPQKQENRKIVEVQLNCMEKKEDHSSNDLKKDKCFNSSEKGNVLIPSTKIEYCVEQNECNININENKLQELQNELLINVKEKKQDSLEGSKRKGLNTKFRNESFHHNLINDMFTEKSSLIIKKDEENLNNCLNKEENYHIMDNADDNNRKINCSNVKDNRSENYDLGESQNSNIKSASPFQKQLEIHNNVCDKLPKATVPFLAKGNLVTKRKFFDFSCHHSIPCELFHVLVKYSKHLMNQNQISSCLWKKERRIEEYINTDKITLSDNSVVPDSCIDNFEKEVAIILPDNIPGVSFKNTEILDVNMKNLKETSFTIPEENNKTLNCEEGLNLNLPKCSQEYQGSSQTYFSNKIQEDNLNRDKDLNEPKIKSSQLTQLKNCTQISENNLPVSLKKNKVQSPFTNLLSRQQIEKDLFSDDDDDNEDEVVGSLSLLSSPKQNKNSLADSPITFKRNRSIKRIVSPNSSSEEEFSELDGPLKKSRKLSLSMSTLTEPNFDQTPKIDSEEMRDFERYDENVWHYYKIKLEKNENCKMDKIKEESKTILNHKETPKACEYIDDTSDDDVIPGTEEVLKNIDSDLSVAEPKKDKNLISEGLSAAEDNECNQTIDLFSQGSVMTTSTTCGLNSSVKELFNKCNMSLNCANKLLNDSQVLSQDMDKLNSNAFGNPKTDAKNNENASPSNIGLDRKEEENTEGEKTVNESNFSESPVLCTQQKKEMESEVEALKNRIKNLEAEMEQKKAQLNNDDKNLSKVNNSILQIDTKKNIPSETIKSGDESYKDSDLESEELFTTFPFETKVKAITLRKRKVASRKWKPVTIICTGLNQNEIAGAHTFSSTLCGSDSKVVLTWTEDVTHVIVKTDEEGMTQRTLKYLLGVVNGSWIVSNSWINDSLNSKILLPEDEYEALDCTGAPGPNRGRNSKKPLFSNFQFILIPPFQDISEEQLIELIKKCGGSIVKNFCEETLGPKLFIIDSEELDIGKNTFNQNKACKIMVGYDWIIECIGSYSFVSLSNYLVGKPSIEDIIGSGIPPSLIHETQEVI